MPGSSSLSTLPHLESGENTGSVGGIRGETTGERPAPVGLAFRTPHPRGTWAPRAPAALRASAGGFPRGLPRRAAGTRVIANSRRPH